MSAQVQRRHGSVWIPASAIAASCLMLAALAALAEAGRPATLPLALAIALISLGALLRPFEPAPGEKFSLAAAIAFFGALVLPGAQAVAAVALAEVVARVIRRTSLVSSTVNVAKAIGAVGAAAAAAEGTRLSLLLAPDLQEVLLAGTAYLVVTLAPIAAMIGWTQRPSAAIGFVVRESLPTATLIAIGALGASVWAASPLLIAMLALPLAMVEVAGRASARLRVAHGALAKALDAQRSFVADAAHELRNPLAAIRGNIAFVRDAGLTPDEGAALADARRDLGQLSALVDRLLLLSAADVSGERRGSADLSVIARAVAIATKRRDGVMLELDLADGVKVALPPELLESLVRDLVANAAAYTERGVVRVAVKQMAGVAELEVRDTGVGIAPSELPRVFDRFFRGSAARSLAPGSGLGLAIARRIAEAHGGSIVLAPVSVGGTSVRVLLPMARTSA